MNFPQGDCTTNWLHSLVQRLLVGTVGPIPGEDCERAIFHYAGQEVVSWKGNYVKKLCCMTTRNESANNYPREKSMGPSMESRLLFGFLLSFWNSSSFLSLNLQM